MANIFDAMNSMLESKPDNKSKSKEKAENLKQELSTSNRIDRTNSYEKSNLFENMLNKGNSETKIAKGHKSAIDNFAKNLSKWSFKKDKTVDKFSDGDGSKSDISALKNSNKDHDSGDDSVDEDGINLDDFMVVDEASLSDENDGNSDNDQTQIEKLGTNLKQESTTLTPVNNTDKISRENIETDLSASPITRSIQKSKLLELKASNETVYSDVTSDESGEIHSDENYLDLSDEENEFMKRVKLVKPPKVVTTKETYEELLSKELKLRKLKSQLTMKNPKVQTRNKNCSPRNKNIPPKRCIEKFIAEQRHIATTQQKVQDVDMSCNSNENSEKLGSLRIEMINETKRKISIVNDKDTSSKLITDTTEMLNNIKDKPVEIDKSSKSGSTIANSDDEDTHPSMSLDGLIIVDEAACESSEHEESEEEQFEVIDSCLDLDEEEEKESLPQIVEDNAIKTNVEHPKDLLLHANIENKNDSPLSRNSDLKDDFDNSNHSFSNAMVIDEVTSPEADNSIQQGTNKVSGNTMTSVNKMSKRLNHVSKEKENEDDIVQPDNVESPKDKGNSKSSGINDKAEKEEEESMFKGSESCEIDNNCVTSMNADIQKQNFELEHDSISDDPKFLVFDESNIQPEDLSENKIDVYVNKPKNVTDLLISSGSSLAMELSKCSSSLQTVDVSEELDKSKSCKSTLESPNFGHSKKGTSESESQTDFSPLQSSSHKDDAGSETTKLRALFSEERISASSEKYLLGRTKAAAMTSQLTQAAHKDKKGKLKGFYTVVRVDSIQNKTVTKKKISIEEKDANVDQSAEANRKISTSSQPIVSSFDKTFGTTAKGTVTSCTSVFDKTPQLNEFDKLISSHGPTSMPSSVGDGKTLSSDYLTSVTTSDLTSLSLDTLTSSVCGVKSCPSNKLASFALGSNGGDANSSNEKSTIPHTTSSVPECRRKDSIVTSACEKTLSSSVILIPSSNRSPVMSSSPSAGLTTSVENRSSSSLSSSTTSYQLSSDGRYTKTSVSVSNKKSCVLPPGLNQSPSLNPITTPQVFYDESSKPCIIISSDQNTTHNKNNVVKILPAKNVLPVTPIQKYMPSLISSPKTGPKPSPKSQTASTVKYLITLKKCDKNGSEADSQPETILTSDLVQSLTKIGTASLVNCQKLVISPSKTIKVIPGQPKSSTPKPIVDIQSTVPASKFSNLTKDLSESTNITDESSQVLPPTPLIICPNKHPQEQATDPLTETESAPSLLNVDYPQPIVTSSSLMKYHDITGIGVRDSQEQDPLYGTDVPADETPFKILKVSDSVLEVETKKKKRVGKQPIDQQPVQYVYTYPVDYNKSEEIIENKKKGTSKAPKRSKKKNPVAMNLTSVVTNRDLYMPPKDKLDNFRGRFLVGKVNGAFICFKCKSKFSEVKYFRWHLWYHIHLHSDFCPTCDSQDPLGKCTTTDSLLQTVATLENEQIFYVMTKSENANSFETYKSLSDVNNQLLLYKAVNLSTKEETKITNDTEYELDPSIKELQPESVNNNNTSQIDDSGYNENEDNNFMGLKILNTFSLSGADSNIPLASSVVDPTPCQSPLIETRTPVTSNSIDTNISSTSKISTSGSFYKCSFCDFSTLFPSEFKNHVYGYHMRSSIYKCSYCDFESFGAGNYISHYGDHVNSVKDDCIFTCPFPGCLDRVNRLEQHLKHLESHENWKPLCCQCSMEFPCLNSLSEHYKKNLISLFSCQYCDAKAVDRKAYLHHVSQIHSLKARMVMVRKTLICRVTEQSQSTDEVSPIKQSPQSNSLSPSSDACFSTFICQKCSFVCNDRSEFLNHKKLHSHVETSLELISVFSCPSCPAAYSTLNHLWEHLQYHDEVIEFYVYKCPYDDFSTNNPDKGILHCREFHPKVHELVQSVIMYKNSIHHCKLCGIKVKERNIFLRHLLIHGKDGEKVAQSLRPLADLDISACIKPTLAVRPSLIQPTKPVSKTPKTPNCSPKKVCILTPQKRGHDRDELSVTSGELEENQPKSEEMLKQKTKLSKPAQVVSNPVNMVVQASPTYKYNTQILDQKIKALYTHKSGFFVCLICQSLFRVKNLLSNHIVEHLEIPYQCCKCGNQNKSYDNAIVHALKSHNMEQINIIYSEAINDKITKIAQSLSTKASNVSQTARDEFSKRVNMLRQHKTFQSSAKTKLKVFTSSVSSCTEVSPNSKDSEEHRTANECRSISAKESEKMAFLQEAATDAPLMKLCKRGVESNWCRICSKPFSRSSQSEIFMKEHILITHLKYKPYECHHCEFSAFSWKSFSVHSRTIHAGVLNLIEEKSIGSLVDSFMKAENIVIEEYTDDQEDADTSDYSVKKSPAKFTKQPTTSSYVCEYCSTKFDCPFKMLRHKKLAHLKTSSNTARKSTTPAAVQQLLRQSSEISSSVLCARKSTTKAANNRQPKSVTQCARKSTAGNPRQSHSQTVVQPVGNTQDVQKFVCPKCDFVTEKRKRAMIYHFKKHGFECFVECNNCQAKYTSMRLLLKHFELIHKGKELHPNYLSIESYFQPITQEGISALKANKQNTSKAVLKIVKPTKSLPPFKCVFCDLEEIKEEFMRYHLYIHLDYKPFKCDQCTKAFSDPFQQKQHINGDHTQKAKSIFDKVNIYETKVSEILMDCRRAVQKQQSCKPWDLEVVQNQLLEDFMNPVNWEDNEEEKETEEESAISVKEEQDIKPGEYLVTLASQSDNLITNNSFQSDGSFSYDSELPDLDVDIKPNRETTKSLADCVALKRKSKSMDKSCSDKQPKLITRNIDSKKKNLIESVFGVWGKEAKKKPKAAKRSLDSEAESPASKKQKYSGEFDAEVILCYYCSFMSESITAVISHTHDVHLGARKNSAVGMLWVDTITGGTYDFEGHIFSNGFDKNITIDFPYLCGTCNYRSVELNDVYEHEQIQHLDLKSSTAFVIKKTLATSGGRGRSTVSYDETNRRKPNHSNSDKSKPLTRKVKVPATSTNTSSSFKESSLAPKTVLSSSLDTSIAPCESSSLKYCCNRCSTICHTEYNYRQHLATHKTFKCLVPDLAKNPHLKCEICSYRAQDAVKFTKHMIGHNGPSVMFLCGYCGFKATSTRAIKLHHHKRHENKSFDITKFVDKKSSYKNHSLIVDLEPQVKLENIMKMSQERFSDIF